MKLPAYGISDGVSGADMGSGISMRVGRDMADILVYTCFVTLQLFNCQIDFDRELG